MALERLRKLQDIITGEPYLRDSRGRMYRRTVCALAWPWSPLPGCVLVLGEERHPPSALNTPRHLHILYELRSTSLDTLISTAEQALSAYKTKRLITPEDDDRFVILEAENDRLRHERRAQVRTESPDAWRGKGQGMLPYYLALLQTRVLDNKTLFFGAESSIPSEASQAGREDGMGRSMIQWPGLCALAWCLEKIDTTPLPEWGMGYRRGLSSDIGPADAVGGY